MIKKIFLSQSKSITGAAVLLGVASFASRLVGVLRDRILAHHFGAGDVLDAYYAAFRIPDLMFNLLIAGAISAGFIPVFLEVWNKNKNEAWKLTSSVLNLICIIFVVVSVILYIFAPSIVEIMAPGFTGEKQALTISLTRIMLISPILLAVSSVISSVLNSLKHFVVFALSPILYNIGIIIGVVFFVPTWGPVGLAWGVALGSLLHVSIQLPALFQHGFSYSPIAEFKNKTVRKILLLTIPRTLGLGASQINLLIMTVIASTLTAGSVTVFNLANNLQYFPIGLIAHSFAIAAFPTLAELVAQDRIKDMISYLSLTIRQVLLFIVPATVGFLLLRAQIVRVVLGSGAFDWSDTILTADTLAFFVLSLFAQSIVLILARAYYALHDTWTPFWISVFGMMVNVGGALYFKDMYGIKGLALAFSLSMCIQLAALWLFLRKKVGTLNEAAMLTTLYKLSIAGLVMAVVVQYSKEPIAQIVNMTTFLGIFIQGIVCGVLGLFFYTLVCHFLKVEEYILLKNSLKRKWLNYRNIDGSISEPSV